MHTKLTVFETPIDILWCLAILVCGIGILQKKNIARIAVIILCFIRFVILLTSVFTHPLLRSGLARSDSVPDMSMGWQMYLFSVIFPIAYVIYFTRPGVKEQFK